MINNNSSYKSITRIFFDRIFCASFENFYFVFIFLAFFQYIHIRLQLEVSSSYLVVTNTKKS